VSPTPQKKLPVQHHLRTHTCTHTQIQKSKRTPEFNCHIAPTTLSGNTRDCFPYQSWGKKTIRGFPFVFVCYNDGGHRSIQSLFQVLSFWKTYVSCDQSLGKQRHPDACPVERSTEILIMRIRSSLSTTQTHTQGAVRSVKTGRPIRTLGRIRWFVMYDT
jgi:hypothetical protein